MIKPRISRVFKDKKGFYILSKGEKIYIKIPNTVKKLSQAQKIFNSRAQRATNSSNGSNALRYNGSNALRYNGSNALRYNGNRPFHQTINIQNSGRSSKRDTRNNSNRNTVSNTQLLLAKLINDRNPITPLESKEATAKGLPPVMLDKTAVLNEHKAQLKQKFDEKIEELKEDLALVKAGGLPQEYKNAEIAILKNNIKQLRNYKTRAINVLNLDADNIRAHYDIPIRQVIIPRSNSIKGMKPPIESVGITPSMAASQSSITPSMAGINYDDPDTFVAPLSGTSLSRDALAAYSASNRSRLSPIEEKKVHMPQKKGPNQPPIVNIPSPSGITANRPPNPIAQGIFSQLLQQVVPPAAMPGVIPPVVGTGIARLSALWSDQIEDYFKPLNDAEESKGNPPLFTGIYASDTIEAIPKQIPQGFIFNTAPADAEDGEHWIAVYISPDSIEYYDPLADEPIPSVVKQLKSVVKSWRLPILMKFKVNRVKDQREDTKWCGYHCIRFLDDRFNGIPYELTTRFKTPIKDESKEGHDDIKREFALI